MFHGQSIIITGGTGSFGKACARTILERWRPRRLVIYSRDEYKQFEMAKAVSPTDHPCVRYCIGDVRDERRLSQAMRGMDVVIHAAAMKQVPTAEYNPLEAIKTNVLGASNIISAALEQGVGRVLALSTDKAVNPINLYGATKLCSDKLFIAGNTLADEDGPRFSVVRYGNVMASRGSVIPFFLERRASGVLPITDTRMTRFWITLQEAVDFVLANLERMVGGEVFVRKQPSMSITDLARALCPECRHEEVGIRPGEKVHEVLIPGDEALNTLDFGDHYVIKPAFDFFGQRFCGNGCRPVPEGFQYDSGSNPWRLGGSELRRVLPESPPAYTVPEPARMAAGA